MKKQLQFLLVLIMAVFWLPDIGYSQVLSESFEGTFPPTDWSIVNNGSGNDWVQNTSSSDASDGSNSMKYGYDGSNDADTWAFTKALSLTNGQAYDITFDYKVSGYPEKLKVTVGNAQTVASQTTTLWDNNGGSDLNNTSFAQASFQFTATSTGTFYFAFNCYSIADQYNLFVDNIVIALPPTCPAPTNQSVTTITSTGAKLNWTTGGASDYGVEYGPSGFTQGSGTYVAVATDEFLTISGLDYASDYDWYVHDSCGTADVSTWIGPNSFSTICGVYTPAYNQDFTNYVPSCWTETQGLLETNSTLSGTSSNWTADGFGNNGSSGSARFNLDGTSGDDWLISPSIDLSGGSYSLEFDIALTKYYGTDPEPFGNDDSLAIVISTDNGVTWDKANIIKVFTSADAISTTGDHIIIDLSAYSTVVQIGFYAATTVDDNDKNVYIDNFGIVTCPMATNQLESDIQALQVQLNWTSNGASNYDIEYGSLGFVPGTGTTISITTDTFKVISGLSGETDYDWYVRDNCGASNESNWSGPSSFTTLATCPIPSNATETSIAATSVQLNWTSGGATDFNIEFGPTGFTQGAGTRYQTVTDTFKLISGLTAYTTYDWYVRDSCDNTDQSYWVGVNTFSTPCATISSFPWTEDFENAGSIPSCWMQDAGNSEDWLFGTSAGHAADVDNTSGSGYMAWIDDSSPYDASPSNLLSPTFNTTSLTSPFLEFYYWIGDGNTTVSTLDIDVYDGTTWQTSVATYTANNGWIKASLDISSYSNANLQLRFSGTEDPASYECDISIDDITIKEAPACLDPTTQTVASLTASGADLGWTDASGSHWDVYVIATGGTAPDQATTPTANDITTNPYTYSAGSANTTYDWYVRSDCDQDNAGTSAWVGPNTFITSPPAHAFPLTEDFESGFDKFDNAAGNSTDFADETTLYHGGTHSVKISQGSSEDNYMHETGLLDLSASSYPMVEFWHIAKTEGGWDKCYIEISTNGGQTYIALDDSLYEGASSNYAIKGYFHEDSYSEWGTGDETPDNTWWKKETFDLTPFKTTNVRFRFKYHTDSGTERDGWSIDDIVIKEKPTNEIEVTNVIGNYGAIGADDFTVTAIVKNNGAVANTVPINYTLDGGAAVSETTPSIAAFSTDTFTFPTQVNSGAVGNHTLAVYSTLAGEEDNTNDTAYTTVANLTDPYSDNFDSNVGGITPKYWTAINVSGNTSVKVEAQDNATYANTGTISLQLYNNSFVDTTKRAIIAVAPKLMAGMTNKQVRFNARGAGSDIIVGVMTDASDTSTFVSMDTITGLTSTYAAFTVVLDSYAGSGKYIAFRHATNTTYDYINIDDVNIEDIPTCDPATNQVVENITATGAKLLWSSGGATNFNIEYGPTGFTQGSGTTFAVATDTFKVISSLTANTTYDWYVQDNCGPGNTSPWIGPNSFRTFQIYPLTEDFESGFDKFDNVAGNSTDFADETTLYHSGAHSVKISQGNSQDNYMQETSLLDLSASSYPMIEFWHIAKTEGGWDKCYIEISTDGGQTYTALDDSLYEGSASDYSSEGYFHEDSYSEWGTGDETPDNTWWKKETFDLTPFKTTNVRFLFKYHTDSGTERDGWSIDDIVIKEKPANEVEVTQILSTYGGFDVSATETVTVEVKNNGTAAQTSIPMKFKLDNGSIVSETMPSLAAFTTDTFTFTTTFDGSAVGIHTLSVYSELAGEENNTNDTAVTTFITNAVTPIPSTFDFPNTSDVHFYLNRGSQSTCEINSEANNVSDNGIFMTSNRSSYYTFAQADVEDAFTNTTQITEANMKVDATGISYVFMDFDLKSQTYYTDCSWFRVLINDSIYAKTLAGDSVWKDNVDWATITFNLSDYAGTEFHLSLQGALKYNESKAAPGNKIYLDNINVYVPPTDEAEVTQVIGNYGAIGTNDFTVKAIIKNNGSTSQTIPINYSLDGGTAVSETSQSIARFSTDTVTFTTQVNSGAVGDYNLAVYTTLAGEADNTNDTAYTTVANLVYPYDENFDSYAAGVTPDYWYKINTTGNSSVINKTQDNGSYAHSGTISLRMYNYSETSGDVIAVLPKLVNGLNGKQLSFWLRGTGSDMIVGVMTDPTDASTFAAVDTIIQPSTTTSQYNVGFSSYIGSGKYVAFKHGMNATYDNFNIDDVYLGTSPTIDLGNDTTICSGSSITLDAGAGYTYSWTNNGYATEIATTQTINPDSAGTYVVKVMDASLYTYDTIVVSNYALPTVALTGTNTICNGDSSEISMTFTGASPWDIIVSANGNLNPETGLTSPTNAYDDPSVTTEYFITQITDNNGCVQTTNSDSITITVNPLPTVGFTALNDACSNNTVNLTSGTPASGWYTGSNVDSTNSTFDAATAGVGIHVITYNYTDANGCTNTAQQNQNVNSLPAVSFTALSDVCVDAASFSLSGGSPTSGTYSGTGVSTGNFDPATATVGSHDITYSYTDANGCTNTAVQAQMVNGLPTVSVTLTDICADATIFSLSGGMPTGGSYSGTNVDGSGNFDPSSGTQSITYTYTDGSGCTNTATTDQTVNALPDVTITAGTNPVPYNTATTLSADVTNGVGTLSYDWSPGVSIDDSTIQAPTTVNITAAIDFSVEVTDGTTNCVNSNNLIITYSGGPVSVSPSSNNSAICTGDTATLNAGGAGGNATLTYTWTSNPSGYSSTSETPEVMPTADTWYIVEATDGTNTDIDSIQIVVNALPTPTFSGLATAYCASDASADLTPTPNGGIFTGTGVNGSAFNPNTAGAGNFDVTYSYTDANGCANTAVNSTVVNDLPTVSFSGLASTYCTNNDDAVLTATPIGGTFSGTGITDSTFSAATAGVGNFDILYTYTDANNCTNTDTNSTVVNGLPNVQFSGLDAAYCVDAMNDTLASLPTGGTFSGTGITADVFSPATAGVGTFDIVYSYTDANNCTNTDTNSTTVNGLPTLSFTGLDADYCVDGASSDLVATPIGGTFTGTGILGANFNPATAGAGNHDITYSLTDGNGCANTVINSTVVNALPTISFTGLDASYCIDANDATLSGNPAGGTFSGTGINGNSFSPSTAGVGSYDVIYNYTDGNSCSNSDTNSTTVNALPIVTVTATNNPVAYNNSTTISASVSNPVGGLSYSWTPASDISGSNTLQTITTNNITIATAFIGEAYDSSTTCSNSDTVTILYTGGPVSVNPIATNATICMGDTASLFAQASGGTTAITYTWTSNPSGFSSTSENPQAIPTQDTWYIVSVTDGSTTASDSVHIVVNALPTPSFTGLDADYCANNADAVLSPTPMGGTFSGTGISGNLFSPMTAGVGSFDIVYTYTDANGCTNTTTNSTVVNGLPSLQITSLEAEYCVDAANDTLVGIPTGGTFSGTGITGDIFSPSTAGAGSQSIVYSYTDANTCTNTDTVVTTVNALPTPSLTLADVCADATTFSLSGGMPTGGSYTGTGVDGAGNFDPSQGTQTITYTYTDANACTNSITASQVVNILPIVTATAAANPVAYNNSTTLSASVSNAVGSLTYDWSPSADLNGSNTLQTVTTNNVVIANSYIVNVTDDGTSCSNTDTIELTYTGGPVSVNPIAVPTYVCAGDDATVKAQSSGGTATITYSWTSNPSGFTSTDASPLVTPTVDTWYYVSATDGTTTVDDSVFVSVNALPTVSFTGLELANCESSAVNNLVPSVSGGIFTGTGVNGSTFNPSVAGVGNFDITYSYTNVNGCSNTAVNSTVVNALPTVTYTDNLSTICFGDSVEAIVNFTGTAPFSYDLNGMTISGVNAMADSFYVNPTVNTTYLVTSVTDNNACTSTGDLDSLQIVVNSLPTVTSSDDASICNGDSTEIVLNFTGASPWSFSIDDGSNTMTLNSTANTYVNYIDPATTTNYIFTSITDGNNCTLSGNIDSILITVNELPTVTASDNDSICIGDSSLVSLTFTGASPWDFTVFDGTNTFNDNTNTVFQVYADPDVTTMYIIKSITDYNGCSVSGDLDSVQVFINSLPTVSFTGLSTDYCDNGLTEVLTGLPSGGTFNGNGINGNIFNPINAGSGNHDIIYTYTDANGCTNYDTNSTIVNAAPTVLLSGLTSAYCANDADASMSGLPSGGSFTGATTSNIFSPSTLGAGSYTVYYTYTDANSCSNVDSALTTVNALPIIAFTSLADACTNSVAFIPTGASPVGGSWSGNEINGGWFIPATSGIGTYYLTYTYTDVNGCSNSDSTTQVVNGIPTVSFTGLATTYCDNAMNDTLVGSPLGGTYTGSGMSNDIFSPSIAGPGSFDIVYTFTDANACSNSDTASTLVNAAPIVNLGVDQAVCINHEITLDAGTGYTSYLWNTGATTQTITVDSNDFNIGNNAYSIEVYNDFNCSDEDTVILIVDPCTGVETPALSKATIKVYPNPTSGQFQIDVAGLENQDYTLDVYNSAGASVYTDKVSYDNTETQTWKLDFSTYAKGIYYIRIYADGYIQVKKIVIQ